ncbi:MAG: zf-HC2 domain-containing protein [Clostridiales bacterium]|jgi:anti-sigma factor RsiW|nr:zf-HC2 domain-containing protein [Clostridiales bacterium]
MECERADLLMMKYMDNALSESEAQELSEHIASCPQCKEDFLAYDKIMSDFAEMEIVEAPPGFTTAVMAKVRLLPPHTPAAEGMLGDIWSAFLVLMGLGFLLAMQKDAIILWMSQYPQLSDAVFAISQVNESVSLASAAAVASFQEVFGQANAVLTNLRFIMLGVFTALAAAQIFLRKKERGKVEA